MANEYLVVRAHDFVPDTQAYYAQDESEADATKERLEQETGREWRVFRRL